MCLQEPYGLAPIAFLDPADFEDQGACMAGLHGFWFVADWAVRHRLLLQAAGERKEKSGLPPTTPVR